MNDINPKLKMSSDKVSNHWNRSIDKKNSSCFGVNWFSTLLLLLLKIIFDFCWRTQNRQCRMRTNWFSHFSPAKGSVSIGCATRSGQCLLFVADWRLRHSHGNDWFRWNGWHFQSARSTARPNCLTGVSTPQMTQCAGAVVKKQRNDYFRKKNIHWLLQIVLWFCMGLWRWFIGNNYIELVSGKWIDLRIKQTTVSSFNQFLFAAQVILWDINTRQKHIIDTGLRDPLTCILWAKSSQLMAVATARGNLAIYNHQTSK